MTRRLVGLVVLGVVDLVLLGLAVWLARQVAQERARCNELARLLGRVDAANRRSHYWPWLWCVALLLLAAPRPARAQDTTRAGAWPVVATTGMSVAITLDLYSTVACRSCREVQPLAALWGDPRHPAGLVLLDVVEVSAVTVLGAELRHSSRPALRRWWWAPAAIYTAAALFSWRHNQGQR